MTGGLKRKLSTMIKTEINFDLGKIKLDFTEELNKFGDIIKSDIKDKVSKGVDIEGRRFQPLKARTVQAKKRKGSSTPNKPLLDTGLMAGKGKGPYTPKGGRATKAKQIEEVIMPKKRQVAGVWHNIGGSTAGQPPQRAWFGISTKAEREGLQLILDHIQREIDRA